MLLVFLYTRLTVSSYYLVNDLYIQLEEESVNFDICLTTPTMLDRFKPLQRILKAKIPNIRRGLTHTHTHTHTHLVHVYTI